jgi:hypothetical protein
VRFAKRESTLLAALASVFQVATTVGRNRRDREPATIESNTKAIEGSTSSTAALVPALRVRS